jgi:hypothetical protein
VQAGYGVTANLGGAYRLVWSGDAAASGAHREFRGSVYTPGSFSSLLPGCGGACPLEADDFVSQPIGIPGGERIDFNTLATTGLDGFDFSVSAEPVYFDLLIDGARYPDLVFFPSSDTGTMVSPAAIPFGLTTR